MDAYFDEITIKNKCFSEHEFERGEYEQCTFVNVDFTKVSLYKTLFIDCEFVDCNLSNVNVKETAFQNSTFKDCKLLGVLFDQCSTFGFSVAFESCHLDYASFYQVDLKGTRFKNTRLIEVNFVEANLTKAVVEECDLLHASFENTILEKSDFRTSINYQISPEKNKLKKAQFSLSSIEGLLKDYQVILDKNT